MPWRLSHDILVNRLPNVSHRVHKISPLRPILGVPGGIHPFSYFDEQFLHALLAFEVSVRRPDNRMVSFLSIKILENSPN
jgi:hypothetical protein